MSRTPTDNRVEKMQPQNGAKDGKCAFFIWRRGTKYLTDNKLAIPCCRTCNRYVYECPHGNNPPVTSPDQPIENVKEEK